MTDQPVNDQASVYFTSAYGRADAVASEQKWVTLLGAQGRWQIPLLLSELPTGHREAQSPYGYSGIYIDPSLSPNDIRQLWDNSLTSLRDLNVVSMFLRFSPFLSQPDTLRDLDRLVLRSLQPTVLVPTSNLEISWRGMEGRSRTAIRKAEKLNMSFRIEEATFDRTDLWEEFKNIYRGTMQRLNAKGKYYFSDQYYEALSRSLADKLRLANVRSAEGELLSSSLIMTDRRAAHYHLSGSTREGARNGSNNFMIWGVTTWAAAQGIDALHLGGGVREGDSLFKFKRSFGGTLCPFQVGQVILDANEYQRLVCVAAAKQGVSVTQLEESGFFPAFNAVVGATET